MCAELASEATGVALMQFLGILGDIYGMEPVLRSLALVAHVYYVRSVAFAPASSRYSAIVRGDARQAGRHPLFSNSSDAG